MLMVPRMLTEASSCGLGGQVKDDLGFGREFAAEVGIANIRLDHLQAIAGQLGCRGQIRPPATAEIVDHRHLVADGQQPVDEVRPNEPRTAGHHSPHCLIQPHDGGDSLLAPDPACWRSARSRVEPVMRPAPKIRRQERRVACDLLMRCTSSR
jgi:hypothetical protein